MYQYLFMCDIQTEIIKIGLLHLNIYFKTTEANFRRCSVTKVFLKISRPVLESPATLFRTDSKTGVFLVKFASFLSALILKNICQGQILEFELE